MGGMGLGISLYLVEREEGDAVGHFRAHALERAQLVAHLRFFANWRGGAQLACAHTFEKHRGV